MRYEEEIIEVEIHTYSLWDTMPRHWQIGTAVGMLIFTLAGITLAVVFG